MTTTQTKEVLPTGAWSADTVHSTAGFEVTMMAGSFRGSFPEFDARLSDGVLRGTAKVASVQVNDSNLAASLQSPEFFDAERHPELSFEARDVSRSGDDITIAGELTLKGHTEAVEITGHITEPAADPFGGERFGLQLETTVDRTKFGLEWNNQLPNGEPALGNEVVISVDLQLVKED